MSGAEVRHAGESIGPIRWLFPVATVRSGYGGVDASKLRALKPMGCEHARYDRMYAGLTRQNTAIENPIRKKHLRMCSGYSILAPGGRS